NAEKDQQTAKEMLQAAQDAEEGDLSGKMKSAQQRIAANKLNEARSRQREALAELNKLVKNLKDRREAELDRLIRKWRKAEREVEKLVKEQERLQKKLREKDKIKDPKKREEELQKLAREQQALRKQTKKVMAELSQLRGNRARQALKQAGEEMKEAD